MIDNFKFDWVNKWIFKGIFEFIDIVYWLVLEIVIKVLEDVNYNCDYFNCYCCGVILGNIFIGEVSCVNGMCLCWLFVVRVLNVVV